MVTLLISSILTPNLFSRRLTAALATGITVPVKVSRGGGVELFVTRGGVAVLSNYVIRSDERSRVGGARFQLLIGTKARCTTGNAARDASVRS